MDSMSASISIPAAQSLRFNFAWSLAGNLVQAAMQWVVVLVLARLGNAEMVGVYALALGIASPAFLLANFHLRTLQATDMSDEFPFSTYLTLRLVTSLTALAALILGAVLFPPPTSYVLVGLAFAKAFESVSELLYGQMQKSERLDHVGQSMILRAVGTLVAVTVAVSQWQSLTFSVLAAAAIAGLVAVIDLRRVGGHRALFERLPVLADLIRLSRQAAPLGLLLVMVSVNSNMPRYFLAGSATPREVGIFSALSYIAVALNTLVVSLGQASNSTLARNFLIGDSTAFLQGALRLSWLALGLGVFGITAVACYGTQIVSLLYGPGYAADPEVMVWLMVGGALSYLSASFGFILSSARCFHPQLPMLAAVGFTTFVCCVWFVPPAGIRGAAQAQAGGYLVQFLISIAMLVFCWKTRFRSHQ